MLDPQALYTLDILLRKYHTLPLVGAHGFLTAAASSLEKRDINILLPFLWGGTVPLFDQADQNNIHHLLSALYDDIKNELSTSLNQFTPLAFIKADKNADVDTENKALQLWCTGYLHGARLDAEYWRQDEQQALAAYFSAFIVLAGDDNLDEALEDEQIQAMRHTLKEKAKTSLNESVRKLYSALAF